MLQKPQSYMLFIMMNTQSIFNTIIGSGSGSGAFENIDTFSLNWNKNKKQIYRKKKKILSKCIRDSDFQVKLSSFSYRSKTNFQYHHLHKKFPNKTRISITEILKRRKAQQILMGLINNKIIENKCITPTIIFLTLKIVIDKAWAPGDEKRRNRFGKGL